MGQRNADCSVVDLRPKIGMKCQVRLLNNHFGSFHRKGSRRTGTLITNIQRTRKVTEINVRIKRLESLLNATMELWVNKMGKVLAYSTIGMLAVLGIALMVLFVQACFR